MGILNSVLVGKARKSAGNITTYNRLGVSCFRQKPTRSPGYKSTVPQLMQQSVYRFMKANFDAAGLSTFVNLCQDAKPRKGKSQTRINAVYRSFVPHLVAEKAEIYALAADEIINPALFVGLPTVASGKLTNGVLGPWSILALSDTELTISKTAIDQLIASANKSLPPTDAPYSIDNLFFSAFGIDKTDANVYRTNLAVNVVPTAAAGIYTFSSEDLAADIDVTKRVQIAITIAAKTAGDAIDQTKRRFSADCAVANNIV